MENSWKRFSEMNLFGHWVPSLLHFKAEHLAVFLLAGTILKKVIPVQFHNIVTFERMGVLEYVSRMGSMSFLHGHRETWQKYRDGFSHVIFTASYLELLLRLPPWAGAGWGTAGRPALVWECANGSAPVLY